MSPDRSPDHPQSAWQPKAQQTAATDECDSLSVALGFAASPAKVRPIVPPPAPPAKECPDATNPANDDCG